MLILAGLDFQSCSTLGTFADCCNRLAVFVCVMVTWLVVCRDNICPLYANAGNHEFVMASFTKPTICDICRKLLR